MAGSNEQAFRDFDLGVRKFAEETLPQAALDFRNAIALEALRGVVLLSPVDEGRLRGNWQVTIGTPAEGYDPDRKDKDGGPTIAAGAMTIDSLAREFGIIWLHNGVPYAHHVNDGVAPYTTKAGNPHPGQPAVHMVEQTVERLSRFRAP